MEIKQTREGFRVRRVLRKRKKYWKNRYRRSVRTETKAAVKEQMRQRYWFLFEKPVTLGRRVAGDFCCVLSFFVFAATVYWLVGSNFIFLGFGLTLLLFAFGWGFRLKKSGRYVLCALLMITFLAVVMVCCNFGPNAHR